MVECTDRSAVATFFAADTLTVGATITLSEEAAHHIRVARVGIGECVALRDGAGKAAVGTLVKVSKSSALVDISETSELSRPAPIHLLAPVADRERMLWLAEKVTELGVTSWRPVLWRRSKSVSPRGEGPMFQAKVRARMTSALIQSGGGWLPDVSGESAGSHDVSAHPERRWLAARRLSRVHGRASGCRRTVGGNEIASREGWRADRRCPDAHSHHDCARARGRNGAVRARRIHRRCLSACKARRQHATF